MRAAYEPPHQFNAVDTRSALKVDFWLARPDPFDQEMLRRRERVTLFGEAAWVSTAEDVILHKLLWNRISPPTGNWAMRPEMSPSRRKPWTKTT